MRRVKGYGSDSQQLIELFDVVTCTLAMPRQPGTQVLPVGRADPARAHLPGHRVEVAELRPRCLRGPGRRAGSHIRSGADTPSRAMPLPRTTRVASASHSRAMFTLVTGSPW